MLSNRQSLLLFLPHSPEITVLFLPYTPLEKHSPARNLHKIRKETKRMHPTQQRDWLVIARFVHPQAFTFYRPKPQHCVNRESHTEFVGEEKNLLKKDRQEPEKAKEAKDR